MRSKLLGPLMLICAALPAMAAPPIFYAGYDYASPGPAALGDVNGDGFPDIVFVGAVPGQDTTVLLGNSNGIFLPGPSSSACGVTWGDPPVLVDLNTRSRVRRLRYRAYRGPRRVPWKR